MNLIKILIASTVMVAVMTSCDESPDSIAQKKVDNYSSYVDSISKVETKDIAMNWEAVKANHRTYKMDANNALSTINNDSEMQNTIDKTSKKFEDFKLKMKKEITEKSASNSKQMIRKTLLGKDFDNTDISYTWINKNNILGVYQNFVNTVIENKDSYTREQWDEIKLMYEGIDSRKNTVENEGLTGEDNRKIAALKLKFAPMYTFNRMGAKSEENEAAKQ
ncbi:hypothetical protein [Psychroflexus montanilacus]|uniref:hypothetical protein n=1 Tax=Psychroflexus montanilacus TaxID=2873598 RepID=UPI001CCCD77D|nr:hypothetical protein [Psychroflexus montanilacus]MBZ9650913.1 hypothetical protein [Psychroflexus montanilacus]